jgi:hypothetical protein
MKNLSKSPTQNRDEPKNRMIETITEDAGV